MCFIAKMWAFNCGLPTRKNKYKKCHVTRVPNISIPKAKYVAGIVDFIECTTTHLYGKQVFTIRVGTPLKYTSFVCLDDRHEVAHIVSK